MASLLRVAQVVPCTDAFALVFWETLTRKDLFAQYTDRDIFTEDIARKGIRPPTEDIHPILRDILVRSWHKKPENRPSFLDLIDLLRKAMVDIFLPTTLCPDAGKFWMKNWPGKPRIPFKSFCEAYSKEFKKLTTLNQESMAKILTEEINKEVLVDIERFSHVLKWFGPIKCNTQFTVANRIEEIMRQPWFFGDIETLEAQTKVENVGVPGAFLIRLNLGGGAKIEEAPFTITTAAAKGSFHTRCYKRLEKDGFIVQIKRGDEKVKIVTKSNVIEDLVRELQHKEKQLCGSEIKGSPYEGLFSKRTVSGYDEAPRDDD